MEDQVYRYVYENCICKPTSNKNNRFIAYITLGLDHQTIGVTEQISRHNLAYKLCYKKHIQEMVKALILLEQRSV